ncbi:MAG: hypothetical protein CSA68_07635 [Rhodobacterales bacterium]|nr:MAG: hypothetical protein CSA68_07635 [Rhodobacterales bacterium]
MRLRRAFWALILGVLAAGPLWAAGCRPDSVDLRGGWGQAHFTVELADTPQKQAKGLMFRKKLPASAGMLFVYDTPRPAKFWMENTLIPLDMLFVDIRGQVTRIKHNARPLDKTVIEGGDQVALILEINGGLARALGISVGSELRHPALDPQIALWPC